MISALICGWVFGIFLTAVILVRTKVPRRWEDEFIVGVVSVFWPFVSGCVFVAIISRFFWTAVLDRIIVGLRLDKE